VGGVVDGATKHRDVRKIFWWFKTSKQINVIKTTSHLHIAASPHFPCIKKDRGIGWGEYGRRQMQLILLWGHHAVDANASNCEW
jgi:hypothetical protein